MPAYKEIDSFLMELLRCEHNNMYALNLKVQNEDRMKAAPGDDRAEGSLGGSGGEEVDRIYTILRLSTLKRHFMKLDRTLSIPQDISLETSTQLKMKIIRLYNSISEFMSDFRVDFDEQPDLVVGHYTKLVTLPKLVNRDPDTRQRLYNAQHLNDPREGKIFVDLLDQRSQENEAGGGFARKIIEAYNGDYLKKSRVYIGSYTASLDKLSMWTRYGSDGDGCCLTVDNKKTFSKNDYIGFDRISLSDKEDSRQFQDSRYALYRVIYYPDITCGGRDLYQDIKDLEKDLEDMEADDLAGGGRQREFTRKLREDMERLLADIREEILYLSSEDLQVNGDKSRGGEDMESQRDEAVLRLRNCIRDTDGLMSGGFDQEKRTRLRTKLENLKLEIDRTGVYNKVNRVIHDILGHLDDINKIVGNLDLESEKGLRFQEELVNITMVILDQVRYLFKSEYYRDEDEYRLIKHSRDAKIDAGEPGNPKLFIEMKEPPFYTEVCLGPQVRNPESLSAYLSNNYRGNEEDGEKLKIRKSSIQYQTDIQPRTGG